MDTIHVFEIYTKHPTKNISGWNIKFVRSTRKHIKTFPHFEEIITVDDGAGAKVINWLPNKQ